MKPLLALFAFFCMVQVPVQAEEIPEFRKRFEALPFEQRKVFYQHIREAQRMFTQKRIFESLDFLAKADAILPNYPAVLSMQGACYVEFRDFDQAKEVFQECYEQEPENYGVLFNLGEVHFVQGEWEESKNYFSKVLELLKNQPLAGNYLLSEFKVYICDKKLGNTSETEVIESKYDYRTDSPAFYYINAVREKAAGNENQAQLWLLRARSVFRAPGTLDAWHDAMIEAGYLDSFYGGEAERSVGDPGADQMKLSPTGGTAQ